MVIAQAFLAPVGLVVLDEPHSGLDAQARHVLDDLIESERTRGAAILMTSHTVGLGPRLDRTYRIADGCLHPMRPIEGPSGLRRIELTATARSCTPEQIFTAPSIHSANQDQTGGVLSLVVEASYADAFLCEAIAKGWTVTGVGTLADGGHEVRPLVRYIWGDALRGYGWIAPALCFFGVEAVICAQNGSILPTYAASAAALLFVSTWITVATVNHEDPVQQSITTVSAGSFSRVRLAKLCVALLAGMVLGLIGVVGPLVVTSSDATIGNVAAGAGAQLLTTLTGVALGALLSRPLVTKGAWAVLLGFGVCLVTIVIPCGPPARQLLVLFDGTGEFPLAPSMLLITLETVVITIVAVVTSLRLAHRRS